MRFGEVAARSVPVGRNGPPFVTVANAAWMKVPVPVMPFALSTCTAPLLVTVAPVLMLMPLLKERVEALASIVLPLFVENIRMPLPLTVPKNEPLALSVSVFVPMFSVLPESTARPAHDAFAVSVTVCVLRIATWSNVPGGMLPTHVDGEVQLPLAALWMRPGALTVNGAALTPV